MKKRLFLLPLAAGLVMSGCSIEDLMFWKKKGVDLPSNFLQEFGGYKLATSIKDGGRYLLGDYRVKYDLIIFASGDYHRNSEGYYPWYMGANAGGTVEGAAEVEVKFLSKDEFSLQVFAEGKPWHQKYIGIYAAQAAKNKVCSVGLFDSPTQREYTDPKKGERYTDVTGKFKWFETYDDKAVYAPGFMFQYPGIDAEAVPKFLGTPYETQQNLDQGKEEFRSFSCESYEKALDYSVFDLAHLYEKK